MPALGEFGANCGQRIGVAPNRCLCRTGNRINIDAFQEFGVFVFLHPNEICLWERQVGGVLPVGDAQPTFNETDVSQASGRIERTHLLQKSAQLRLAIHS